ncbi:MAG TPA: DHH family phosphoesterase [Phycisphaerae bacterium]|nr:DHH family phosphoesterase [Phycisphaerae bacterium]
MSGQIPTPPRELVDLIGSWRRVVCVGHVTPDPDCLGAMFALGRARTAAGAGHWSACLPPGSLSSRNQFLVDMADLPLATAADLDAADGFVVVDTARRSRCNLPAGLDEAWPDGKTVACVDHHVSNTRFGDVNWVEPHAASSCELIYALLRALDAPIDAVIANLLYAGLMTDTAGFSLPATNSFMLRAAADLVDLGADVGMIGMRLNRARSIHDFRLNRVIHDNTHLAAGGRIAYSTASFAEIQETGCGPADIDDQVKIPRSLACVRVAILFTEAVENETRINFRGEDGFNVLPLAERFGGGGHELAAGARMRCPVDQAVEHVIPVAAALVCDTIDAA